MNNNFFEDSGAFSQFLETEVSPDTNYDEFKSAHKEIIDILDLQSDYLDLRGLDRELSFLRETNPLKHVALGIVRRYVLSLERDARMGSYDDLQLLIYKTFGIVESQLFRPDFKDETLGRFRSGTIKELERVNNPYVREVIISDLESDNGYIIAFLRDEYKVFQPEFIHTDEVTYFEESVTPEEEFEIDSMIEDGMIKHFNGRTRAGKYFNRYVELITRFQSLDLDQEEAESLNRWYENNEVELVGRLKDFKLQDARTVKEIRRAIGFAITTLEEQFIERYKDEYDNDREAFSTKYRYFTESIMSKLIKRFEDSLEGTSISNPIAINMVKSIFSYPASYFNLSFPDQPIRHLVDSMYNVLIKSNSQ